MSANSPGLVPRFVIAAAFTLLLCASSRATIRYEISLAHPERHTFHIKMVVPNVSRSLTVQMPAWNALYEIRDFASHVLQVSAANEWGPLPIEKLDKQTWRIRGGNDVVVSYDTVWDEPGPFAAQLSAEHAFFNAAMILMYVPERRSEDVNLIFKDVPAGWRFDSPNPQNPFRFEQNYDAIADAPYEIGQSAYSVLTGASPQIEVVVHGRILRPAEFEQRLAMICRSEIQLMGKAPFKRYTFIVHIGENVGGGGMEHANGTAIAARNEEQALTIAAHEFFHLWNVKRIRPASLEPVDYTKEQYTKSLWFAEGVTSTYEKYTLLRAGLWTKTKFYEDWSREISELENSPANKWQSAEQSSLDTWLEKYPIYNQPDHSVSYYTKGAVIGLLLDLWIRQQTNNTRSLDDMMRAMNENFGITKTPYDDRDDLEDVCTEVAATPCEEFFDNYVSGTKPFPYDEYFGFAGLKIRRVVHSAPQMGSQTFLELSEDDAANEKQKRIRMGILSGATDEAKAKAAD